MEVAAGVAERGQRLLAKISVSFLESRVKDSEGEPPAKFLLGYSTTKLRKQKILCQQLQVIKFLLDFMPQAHTSTWADEWNLKATRNELNETKGQWKALKEEYLELVEKIEWAIPLLLSKQEQLKRKKAQLKEALAQYQAQAEASKNVKKEKHAKYMRLVDCVKDGHGRIRLCEQQIQKLQDDIERHQEQVNRWMEAVRRDVEFQQLMETLRGVQLLSICEQEMVLHVKDPGGEPEEPELKPLRLTLRWSPEDKLQIQTDSTSITGADVLPEGGVSDVKQVILEMQNTYSNQAQLLQELQELQDKLPIDWRPKERKLLFLKGRNMCVLYIEPGYPTSGGVQLLSLHGPASSVDVRLLKPPHESPTLCNWLVYLSCSAVI